jgi:regulator of protease activity HflC (stomatin/prohibitin superfamily)
MNIRVPTPGGVAAKRPRIGVLVGSAVAVFAIAVGLPNIVENLDANQLMVIQSPLSGNLTCYTEPGPAWQGFGRVTKYPRRATYNFDAAGQNGDTSKKLRFNDGGHANLYGSINWEMPTDCKSIVEIHKTFGSADGVENQGVSKMIDLAIYLSGPLMSSTESSGERRSELTQLINDQAQNGVYQTTSKQVEAPDPITGEKKQVTVVEIAKDDKGLPKRQQGSILSTYQLKLLPISIKEIKYDGIVEKQIAQRQAATTQVQIAQANARKAEQDAITIAKEGEATAAKAKWEQETIKAKMVTEAEQKLQVATLAAKEAEQFKKEQVLRGEGEAARKRLVMEADGALDQKLEALVKINEAYAEAIKSAQPGAWTPAVTMGGSGNGSNVNGAQALMEMFAAKTAKDFGVDMAVGGRGATAKK